MGTFANVGINQIAIVDKGTLLTTPAGIIALGLRTPSSLEFAPFNPITDYRDRDLRNMINARIQAKTLQPTLAMLNNLFTYILPDRGGDVELLAVPQSSGVDGGCFQFNGNDNYMGVEFDWIMNAKERTLAFDLQVALEFEEMKALIDAADSNTLVTLGLSNYGIDFTKQKHPYIVLGDATFTKDELIDYNFSFKNIGGERSLYNRLITDYIQIQFDFIVRAATISNIVTVLGRDQSPAVTIREDNNVGATLFDRFVCNANVLSLAADPIYIGDDKRYLKLVYKGKVPTGNVTLSYTTANGGNNSDFTDGGTVTVAA
jgi:hypothetical protein